MITTLYVIVALCAFVGCLAIMADGHGLAIVLYLVALGCFLWAQTIEDNAEEITENQVKSEIHSHVGDTLIISQDTLIVMGYDNARYTLSNGIKLDYKSLMVHVKK